MKALDEKIEVIRGLISDLDIDQFREFSQVLSMIETACNDKVSGIDLEDLIIITEQEHEERN